MRIKGAVAIIAMVLGGATAVGAQRGPLQQTPEHRRLGFLEGDWETSLIPAGGGESLPGRVTFGWDVGGVWLVQRYRVEFPGVGVREEMGAFTFDSRRQAVVGFWIDNLSGAVTTFAGEWTDTETLVLRIPEVKTAAGDTFGIEVSYMKRSPTEVLLVQRQSRNGGTLEEVVRVEMRKATGTDGALEVGASQLR